MQKAQASVEALIAGIIVMFILLAAVILIGEKMNYSQPLIDESNRFAECQKIAETILSVQNAEAVTEQTIFAEGSIKIEKNNIVIGNTSCNYFGIIEGQDVSGGITLESGKITVSKDAGGIVHVEEA